MNAQLPALTASAARLRRIAGGLDPSQLSARAYPTEWTIADVLSHIGSGAVIMRKSIETTAAGTSVPDGFNQSVWDEWNAKEPAAQAAEALVADQALLDAAGAISDADGASMQFSLGPMTLDLPGFLGMRLSEHALHTWDIEVVGDPTATVPSDAAGLIVANLGMIAGFSAKPDGRTSTVTVHTDDPAMDFTISTTADSVALQPATAVGQPDISMPTESLVRLVYGRLDPDHTPGSVVGPDVDRLRAMFPGF